MGYWGFKPFENDYALDTYGGYHSKDSMKGQIWQGIRRGASQSVDAHEILGLILGTFGLYDFCPEDKINICLNAIKNKKYDEEVDYALYESMWAFLSACTIEPSERVKMLEYAANKMKSVIETNNYEPSFSEDGIWMDDVTGDEENFEYQVIYNMARRAINNGFKGMESPVFLPEGDVAWLHKAYQNNELSTWMDRMIKDYPSGISAMAIGGETHLYSNHNGLYVGGTDRLNRISNQLTAMNKQFKDIGLNNVDAGNWFKDKYPSGFYLERNSSVVSLVSVDNGKKPWEEDGYWNLHITPDFVRSISNYVKVYKSKEEADKYINIKPGAIIVKCLDKRYKGVKIIAYLLQDQQGKTIWTTPDDLKKAIENGQINCVNLKLTSDNRLISI